VLGADYYPVGRTDISDGINQTAAIAQAVQSVANLYGKQSAMVLQANNWGWGADPNMNYLCQPFPSCVPTPTTGQMTLMKNLTLQNSQPRLILWYSYFDIFKYDSAQWNNLVAATGANGGSSGSSLPNTISPAAVPSSVPVSTPTLNPTSIPTPTPLPPPYYPDISPWVFIIPAIIIFLVIFFH
jgi:hypothetical protein